MAAAHLQCRCDTGDQWSFAVERYNNGHAVWYATGIGAYLRTARKAMRCSWWKGPCGMFGPGPLRHTNRRGNDAYRTSPSIDDKTAVAEAKDVALERFGKGTRRYVAGTEGEAEGDAVNALLRFSINCDRDAARASSRSGLR